VANGPVSGFGDGHSKREGHFVRPLAVFACTLPPNKRERERDEKWKEAANLDRDDGHARKEDGLLVLVALSLEELPRGHRHNADLAEPKQMGKSASDRRVDWGGGVKGTFLSLMESAACTAMETSEPVATKMMSGFSPSASWMV